MINMLVLAVILQPPSAGHDADAAAIDARSAIQRGVKFLVQDQNAEGSWGGPHDSVTTWSGPVWPNPETHRAWKVATTGLCCAALLQTSASPEAVAAADRGLRYIIDNANVRRPDVWDTMNNWAYIYGLQGLAAAYGHAAYADAPLRDGIAEAAAVCTTNLARFQSLNGGWGYLEFDVPRTRQPQWATSFMTASAIVAMEQARRVGLPVDERVLGRATRIVQRCELPNGGYTYSVRPVPNMNLEYIDQVKGSLCRIQVCQAALLMGGREITVRERLLGLEQFFAHHKFLDIAVLKPVPHEAYYYNSGYFYFYGHYYAALVINGLPATQQSRFWPQLRREILKMQQADGSMWDYDMHRYDRPYSVSFAIMALEHGLTNDPD